MNVLVAVDFSEVTQGLIDSVQLVAGPTDSRIVLLYVAEPDPAFVGYDAGPRDVRDQVAREYRREHEQIQGLAQTLRDRGFNAEGRCIPGSTVETILSEADRLDADLIVIGSHGHGAVYDVVVGSISDGVIRRGNRPVLVIPSRR